jgi:hypothetical protein
MELLGTQFSLTLGSWRLRFAFAVEDVEQPPTTVAPPHHVRIVPERTYSTRN